MQWTTAIRLFENYLRLERSASPHTIEAYRKDVEKLARYSEPSGVMPDTMDADWMKQFIYDISKVVQPRTQARIISGIRAFFEYLILENYLKENPAALIESPKVGRKLPDTLSVEEIDRIIDSIDLSHPQGERNRAILETLYGCGLRVSELVQLKISDLFLDFEFIISSKFMPIITLFFLAIFTRTLFNPESLCF